MTAALKIINGNTSVPALAFGSEPTLGFYRAAAATMGIAGSLSTTGDVAIAGALTVAGSPIIPIGLGPLPWSGLTAPTNWLLCYGQTLVRATYPDLWDFASDEIAAGNTLFGSGDGSTTFTIMDLRGRLPAGKDNMGGSAASRLTSTTITSGANTLGNSGGEQTHVLTNGELATHQHAVFLNDPGHTHTGNVYGATITVVAASGASVVQPGSAIPSATTGLQVRSASGGGGAQNLTADSGNSTAHNNVQPTIITNYIIYAGV